jgi:hypothetical protein
MVVSDLILKKFFTLFLQYKIKVTYCGKIPIEVYAKKFE